MADATDTRPLAAPRARDTPGPTAAPQQIDGLLVVDFDNRRARYDCYRTGCPQRREGPVHDGGIPEFVRTIKTEHLARYHGEQR
ncbi:hypothetical protein GPA10_24865 [Streptomyces sp. p1417]|uniref:Uncharacterized protein n=1 Tax=Streptomyces typhae TaxID=2681492 RepID=A0A6L6X2N2_9ACTN|nr:hypothetical protein [Streptomyces typhae]MVO87900.1 hypothetical protein [Streptomyces typhae]